MAPTSKRRSSEKPQAPTTTRRIMTRSIYKQSLLTKGSPMKSNFAQTKERFLKAEQQQQQNENNNNSNINSNSSSTTTKDVCATPKSEKYKIPEIMTCPPAPKKPKTSKCLFQKRRPISFFAHPDIDKFFVFAMRDAAATTTPATIKCE